MRSLFAVAFLAAVAGCQSAPAAATGEAEPLLTTTLVTLADDGTRAVSVLSETESERAARLAGVRTRGAATPLTTAEICGDGTYSDLYLCDTTNTYCSGGNVACIYGYGSIPLASIQRGAGNWRGAVRQYEPDSWSGQFLVTSGNLCSQWFSAGYTIANPAGACAQAADTVKICKANSSICSSSAQCCSGRCSSKGLLRVCY